MAKSGWWKRISEDRALVHASPAGASCPSAHRCPSRRCPCSPCAAQGNCSSNPHASYIPHLAGAAYGWEAHEGAAMASPGLPPQQYHLHHPAGPGMPALGFSSGWAAMQPMPAAAPGAWWGGGGGRGAMPLPVPAPVFHLGMQHSYYWHTAAAAAAAGGLAGHPGELCPPGCMDCQAGAYLAHPGSAYLAAPSAAAAAAAAVAAAGQQQQPPVPFMPLAEAGGSLPLSQPGTGSCSTGGGEDEEGEGEGSPVAAASPLYAAAGQPAQQQQAQQAFGKVAPAGARQPAPAAAAAAAAAVPAGRRGPPASVRPQGRGGGLLPGAHAPVTPPAAALGAAGAGSRQQEEEAAVAAVVAARLLDIPGSGGGAAAAPDRQGVMRLRAVEQLPGTRHEQMQQRPCIWLPALLVAALGAET